MESCRPAVGSAGRFAADFGDRRDASCVQDAVTTLIVQRVVGIAPGREAAVDHDRLRHVRVMAAVSGEPAAIGSAVAGVALQETAAAPVADGVPIA